MFSFYISCFVLGNDIAVHFTNGSQKYLQENIKMTQTQKARWGAVNFFFSRNLYPSAPHTQEESEINNKVPSVTSFQRTGGGEQTG